MLNFRIIDYNFIYKLIFELNVSNIFSYFDSDNLSKNANFFWRYYCINFEK